MACTSASCRLPPAPGEEHGGDDAVEHAGGLVGPMPPDESLVAAVVPRTRRPTATPGTESVEEEQPRPVAGGALEVGDDTVDALTSQSGADAVELLRCLAGEVVGGPTVTRLAHGAKLVGERAEGVGETHRLLVGLGAQLGGGLVGGAASVLPGRPRHLAYLAAGGADHGAGLSLGLAGDRDSTVPGGRRHVGGASLLVVLGQVMGGSLAATWPSVCPLSRRADGHRPVVPRSGVWRVTVPGDERRSTAGACRRRWPVRREGREGRSRLYRSEGGRTWRSRSPPGSAPPRRLPAISTGIYGYPPERASEVAVTTVRDAAVLPIDVVTLVAFDPATRDRYETLLA